MLSGRSSSAAPEPEVDVTAPTLMPPSSLPDPFPITTTGVPAPARSIFIAPSPPQPPSSSSDTGVSRPPSSRVKQHHSSLTTTNGNGIEKEESTVMDSPEDDLSKKKSIFYIPNIFSFNGSELSLKYKCPVLFCLKYLFIIVFLFNFFKRIMIAIICLLFENVHAASYFYREFTRRAVAAGIIFFNMRHFWCMWPFFIWYILLRCSLDRKKIHSLIHTHVRVTSVSFSFAASLGYLEFELQYNSTQCTLQCNIIKARVSPIAGMD